MSGKGRRGRRATGSAKAKATAAADGAPPRKAARRDRTPTATAATAATASTTVHWASQLLGGAGAEGAGAVVVVGLAPGASVVLEGLAEVRVVAGAVDILGTHLLASGPPSDTAPEHDEWVAVASPCTGARLSVDWAGVSREETHRLPHWIARALAAPLGLTRPFVDAHIKRDWAVLLLRSSRPPGMQAVAGLPGYRDVFGAPARLGQHTFRRVDRNDVQGEAGSAPPPPPPPPPPVVSLPTEWRTAAEAIVQSVCAASGGEGAAEGPVRPVPRVVLVCGARDVGKSTFCRYLVNRLLSAGAGTLGFLDCDAGQPEFTPPGFVSLSRVEAPLLGPPCLHLRPPLHARFLGATSPKDDPRRYLDAIRSLLFEYRGHASDCEALPLVVNTMGWTKGLGLPLLLDVIRAVRPDCIVQIESTDNPSRNLPSLGPRLPAATLDDEGCEPREAFSPKTLHVISSQPAGPESVPKFSSKELREITIQAYFGELLCHMAPYAVPFGTVAVGFTHGHRLRPAHALKVLNASLVGLASSPTLDAASAAHNSQLRFCDVPAELPFLGLGVVRGIDVDKGLLYIATPVPERDLAHVNVIAQGDMVVPTRMFLAGTLGEGPYSTFDFSSTFVRGGSSRKTRTNLARKKLAE